MCFLRCQSLTMAFMTMALTIATAGAEDRFQGLIERIPSGANAVMAIDVEAVGESALARKEGRKASHTAAYVERPLILPPETALIMVASPLDPKQDLAQQWKLAVMELSAALPLAAIARAEGGQLDKIDDLDVVWSPSEVYFIEFGPRQLAVMSPDDRQYVARWALAQKSGQKGSISPSLQQAVGAVSAPQAIVPALDLSYAI